MLERRSHLFNTAADAAIDRCRCILEASRTGTSRTMECLLMRGRIDPSLGGGCPLVACTTEGLLSVARLLLSAGASPCAGRGLTAIQVAHSKRGLPAVFAALYRIVSEFNGILMSNDN